MDKRNCPNCGAAIAIDDNKCPYCGTSYYDLSCMPTNEPFFLRIDQAPYADGSILTKAVLRNATLRADPYSAPEIDLEIMCLPNETEVFKKQ